MPGGGRYDLTVSAEDVLPTAETIVLAKGFAARACAERAAALVWSSQRSPVTWIERVPTLALAALIVVCPEVTPERLARCLGLDPLGMAERLQHAAKAPGWSEDLVAVVAQQIARGA